MRFLIPLIITLLQTLSLHLNLLAPRLLGAFIPGVPVQPVVMRYPNKMVSDNCYITLLTFLLSDLHAVLCLVALIKSYSVLLKCMSPLCLPLNLLLNVLFNEMTAQKILSSSIYWTIKTTSVHKK